MLGGQSKSFFIAAGLAIAGLLSQSAVSQESLNFVVYGASGRIGGKIVEIALDHGHSVVGVSRNPARLTFDHDNFSAVAGDITDPDSVRAITANADVVAISVVGNGEGNRPENSTMNKAAETMIAVHGGNPNGPHILQIGGATTMLGNAERMVEVLRSSDTPASGIQEGSEPWGMVFGHMSALETYRGSDLNWTVVTPPFDIQGRSSGPGMPSSAQDRLTGQYRTSTSDYVRDAEGNPTPITQSDLAHSLISAAENGEFIKQRFTMGY